MNEEEIRIVLEILTEADNGCEHCATDLFESFLKKFPSSIVMAKEIYKEAFDEEFEIRQKVDLGASE